MRGTFHVKSLSTGQLVSTQEGRGVESKVVDLSFAEIQLTWFFRDYICNIAKSNFHKCTCILCSSSCVSVLLLALV